MAVDESDEVSVVAVKVLSGDFESEAARTLVVVVETLCRNLPDEAAPVAHFSPTNDLANLVVATSVVSRQTLSRHQKGSHTGEQNHQMNHC